MDWLNKLKKRDWTLEFFLLAEMVVLTLIFIRFPWHGSFFSDIDIWFYVLQLNDFFLNVINDPTYGRFFYPATDYRAIMDSPAGLGVLILPFKFLFSNDLWGYFFFTIFLLAMDGYAFSLFATALGVKRWIAMVLGFLFIMNNFMMSQLDNFNSIAMFPGILSAYFLLKFMKSQKGRGYLLLAASAYLAGFQLYVSIYHFVFQFLLFLLVSILFMDWKRHLQWVPAWGFILGLLSLPFFLQHGAVPEYLTDRAWLMPQIHFTELHSISIKDFFRVHPGNLLYPEMHDIPNPWRYGARSAFLGYATYLLAAACGGWMLYKKHYKWLLAIGVTFVLTFILASGPFLDFGNIRLKTPAGWVNTWMPGTMLFRHLFRAYHYIPLSVMLMIGYVLTVWKPAKPIYPKALMAIFALLFLLENVPWRAELNESYKFIEPPVALEEIMENVEDSSNVYFLPSCEQFSTEAVFAETMNPHSREFIYANWKQSFPINTFNGRLAYLTQHAFNNNQLLCHMDSIRFSNLLLYNDIDYFIVAKEYTDEVFRAGFDLLMRAKCDIIAENAQFTLYDPRNYSRTLAGTAASEER